MRSKSNPITGGWTIVTWCGLVALKMLFEHGVPLLSKQVPVPDAEILCQMFLFISSLIRIMEEWTLIRPGSSVELRKTGIRDSGFVWG